MTRQINVGGIPIGGGAPVVIQSMLNTRTTDVEGSLKQIRQLNNLAADRGQTLAQMALSWVLRDGIVTSILAGASRPEQILDNIKAAENTAFTEDELKLIDQISLKS